MAAETAHFLLFFGSQRLGTAITKIHFEEKKIAKNNVAKDDR